MSQVCELLFAGSARVLRVAVCVALVASVGAQSLPTTRNFEDLLSPPATAGQKRDLWRTVLRCGPNSLYMLALAQGHSPDFKSLCDLCEPGVSGCSMEQLVQAATALGLDVRAGRLAFANLLEMKEPVILHLEEAGVDSAVPTGHYVIAAGWDRGSLAVIDGSNATSYYLTPEQLQRVWSGYVLSVAPSGHAWAVLAQVLAALCGYVAVVATRALAKCLKRIN